MNPAGKKTSAVLAIVLLAGLAFVVSAWTSYSVARVLIIEGIALVIIGSLAWLAGRRRT